MRTRVGALLRAWFAAPNWRRVVAEFRADREAVERAERIRQEFQQTYRIRRGP